MNLKESQDKTEILTDVMEERGIHETVYDLDEGLREETKRLTEDLRKTTFKNEGFKTDAPKINLDLLRHLTDIAKKRDDHFDETQSYIRAVILSLGSVFSLLFDNSPEAIDQMSLVKNFET